MITNLTEVAEFLRSHLRIEASCDTDYFGVPELVVTLLLENERICETKTTIPEHNVDPDW